MIRSAENPKKREALAKLRRGKITIAQAAKLTGLEIPEEYLAPRRAPRTVRWPRAEIAQASRVPVGRKFNSLADMDAMNADIPETQEAPEIKNRLVSLGHQSATKKKPLAELNAKGKLLVEYMVEGCRHDWITRYSRPAPTGEDPERRVPIEPGQPLSLIEAADALRIRRRNARWIASQPVFQRELAKALQAFREGHKAEALRTVVGVMRDKGEGTAADKKVQLSAASMILGEAVGPAPTKPSVSVNVGVQLAPGVVIRLPAGLPTTPLERQAIEAQADREDEP